MELYCLVENRNGFEQLLAMGIESEMQAEKERLEKANLPASGDKRPIWEKVSYYITPRHEWSADCPLMPVDLS